MDLNNYKMNVTSQFGEDGIIEKIFKVIGTKSKCCIEFGAWDGKHLSNTWNLINNNKWNALLLELDEKKINELINNYKNNSKVQIYHNKVNSTDRKLDVILQHEDIKDIDLLSIDVDGDEYHIWESINEIKPRVVIIEFNPTIPPHIGFIGEEGNMMTGSSALAITRLGIKKGYELICCTDVNAIFVLKELFSLFEIKDNSVEKLMLKDKLTYVMSTYNGKAKVMNNPFYINVYG